MDHDRFRQLVGALYATVKELEVMFPGRPFTPDGHLVGSLGECLVADAYDLELMPPSTGGFDAMTRDGRRVEIKATQGDAVAFRSGPEHCIAIRILPDGTFREVFNGPGDVIWSFFGGKPRPTNGQFRISLSRLADLQKNIPEDKRIPRK